MLVAAYGAANGYRLADGRFTTLRQVAEEELTRLDPRPVYEALLRLPIDPEPRTRPTPARAGVLLDLARVGLLPQELVDHVLEGGSLGDREWETLRPLRRVLAVDLDKCSESCWTVRYFNLSGLHLDLPIRFDGGRYLDALLPPADVLAEMLAVLATQGWHPGWWTDPDDWQSATKPATGPEEASTITIELFRRRSPRARNGS